MRISNGVIKGTLLGSMLIIKKHLLVITFSSLSTENVESSKSKQIYILVDTKISGK